MSHSKNFVYLIQGESKNLGKYESLKKDINRDIIMLTYDEKIDDAIFFPNSTWAEGRNKLLSEAQKLGSYEYFIFCDDDIEFISGDFALFEKHLEQYRPAVGVPTVPRTEKTIIKLFRNSYQSFLFNDEQMIAFHKDVIESSLVMPYYLEFDHVHWWATCQIQEILIQTFYGNNSIQFNDIKIDNLCHDRYDSEESGESLFRGKIRQWLSTQFSGNYTDIREKYKRGKLKFKYRLLIIIKTLVFKFKLRKFAGDYNINNQRVGKMLQSDSVISKRLTSISDIG